MTTTLSLMCATGRIHNGLNVILCLSLSLLINEELLPALNTYRERSRGLSIWLLGIFCWECIHDVVSYLLCILCNIWCHMCTIDPFLPSAHLGQRVLSCSALYVRLSAPTFKGLSGQMYVQGSSKWSFLLKWLTTWAKKPLDIHILDFNCLKLSDWDSSLSKQ